MMYSLVGKRVSTGQFFGWKPFTNSNVSLGSSVCFGSVCFACFSESLFDFDFDLNELHSTESRSSFSWLRAEYFGRETD